MDYLALTVNNKQIQAPTSVPTGGIDTLAKVLGNAMTIMLIIAAILSLIYFVLGAVQWTSSGGDKGKVAAARAKLTYAIIGLVVSLGAFLIISIFGALFNVKLFGF